jgi:hypothetical protein
MPALEMMAENSMGVRRIAGRTRSITKCGMLPGSFHRSAKESIGHARMEM